MKYLIEALIVGLAWALDRLPVIFGYAYTAALIVLGGLVLLTGHASSGVHTALVIAVWGYVAVAVINFYVMVAFGFRNCCIGMSTFKGHIKHSWRVVLADALWSPLWPITWHGMVRNLAGWGMDWVNIAIEPTATATASIPSTSSPVPRRPPTSSEIYQLLVTKLEGGGRPCDRRLLLSHKTTPPLSYF